MTGSAQAKQFFSVSRLAIVAGKGGVGKTVVAAAWARAAAMSAVDTVVIALDGRTDICSSLGIDALHYGETPVAPRLAARAITADDALIDYLTDHGMRRVARHLHASGVLEMVATATPGIRDLVVLGKIKQLEATRTGLIVVDAPAAGHAITFLDSARALHATARVGPIRDQAADVLALLRDPSRAQVILVTIPEETPVNELVETAFRLEDEVGVALGPIVVNGVLPEIRGLAEPLPSGLDARSIEVLSSAAEHWQARFEQQQMQIERLRRAVPIEQIHLHHIFSDAIAERESAMLADELIEQVSRRRA